MELMIEKVKENINNTEYTTGNLAESLAYNCERISDLEKAIESISLEICDNAKKAENIKEKASQVREVKLFGGKKKNIEEIQDIVKDLALSNVQQNKIINYLFRYQQIIGDLIEGLNRFAAINIASNDALIENIKDILQSKANGNMSDYLKNQLEKLLRDVKEKQSTRKRIANIEERLKIIEKYDEKECIKDDEVIRQISLLKEKLKKCNDNNRQELLDELFGLENKSYYADELLGDIYYFGEYGVEKDEEKGKYYYIKASEEIESAQWILSAIFYHEGDIDNWEKYLVTSAENGYDLAQTELGKEYYYGINLEEDEDEAFYWFEQAAKQGEPEAKILYARLVYIGYGEEESDEELGAKLYMEALDDEECDSYYSGWDYRNIGECYLYGHYVEKDYEEAVEWFEYAIDKGEKYAYCKLGECYYFGGYGIEKDLLKAEEMFNKAIVAGDTYAYYWMGCLYQHKKDYDRAITYYEKYLDDFEASSLTMYYISYCFANLNCKTEAFNWCLKAAEAGELFAMYQVAIYYYNGDGVEKDYWESLSWFESVVEDSNVGSEISGDSYYLYDSYLYLGIMYMYGQGCDIDYDKAKSMLHIASKSKYEEESTEAKRFLGMLYHNIGDDNKARYWLKESADDGNELAVELLIDYDLE